MSNQKEKPVLVIRFLIICFFLVLTTACSAVPTVTPTQEPTTIPTNTPEPTITPSPEPEVVTFEITFDGSECVVVSGPAEVPLGSINIAAENTDDLSKDNLSYGSWVVYFLDGKTFQDFLDEIYKGPKVSHPTPDWVEYPFYFTKDHKVTTINLKETGEHAIFYGSYTPWREFPCGSFQVVDAPSE